MKCLAAAVMLFAITGCVNTKIIDRGGDRYTVNAMDSWGMNMPSTVEAKALKVANDHCKKKGKQMETEECFNGGIPVAYATYAQVYFRCMSSARTK